MLSAAELDRMAADTGCSVHDDCLSCPLDECILIVGRGGLKTLRKRQRNDTIREMVATMSYKEIADQLGISQKTIGRALAK